MFRQPSGVSIGLLTFAGACDYTRWNIGRVCVRGTAILLSGLAINTAPIPDGAENHHRNEPPHSAITHIGESLFGAICVCAGKFSFLCFIFFVLIAVDKD